MAKNNGTKATAFVIGAALGSVVALMFAPFSGRKMRKITTEKGKQALGEAKNKYGEFEKDTLKPNLEKAKIKGKEWWGKTEKEVKDRAEDFGQDVRDGAEDLKDKASEKVSSLRNRLKRTTPTEE